MDQSAIEQLNRSFHLPDHPVVFRLTAGLAFCSREPYRTPALRLEPGQPARLVREASNAQDSQAIRVETTDGTPVGYLYAVEACYLSILMDYCRDSRDPAGELADRTRIRGILTGAQPGQQENRRLRYPKITLDIKLELRQAWPLFTILAILQIKTESREPLPILAANSWLNALPELQNRYRCLGHDRFVLPPLLAEAWIELTGSGTRIAGET